MFSLPLTLIILVIAFGALVAAGIPLLLALTAVFATFGLVALPSHLMPLDQEARAVVLLIGLAVGVDYSMFYLRREREERAAGRSEQAALEAAAATSGRSVLISGLTVMAAMAGMFLTGDATFASFGYATMIVVAVAMLGSLTVLPALLSKLGDRVDRLQRPARRPAAAAAAARAGSGARSSTASCAGRCCPRCSPAACCWRWRAPALQLRMATPGADTFPKSLPVVKTYDRMQQAFPGSALPATRRRQGARRERAGRPRARSRGSSGGRSRAAAIARADHGRDEHGGDRRERSRVPIDGNGTDAASKASLAALRDEIVPADRRRASATPQAGVTGLTAEWQDQQRPDEVEAADRVRLRARCSRSA